MFIVDIIKKAVKPDESPSKKSPIIAISPLQFSLIRKISQSHFPVYQISLTANHEDCAMKIFPYKEGKPHSYYKNEARFTSLNHPNVVKGIHNEPIKNMSYKGETKLFSYILMEYAPYGDFLDIIKNYGTSFDEKMIRTYFRQLIEGLEYLHANHVAHLDLKLENLLMGSDFMLKIADFDRSYIKGDKRFLGSGTESYRAPELMNFGFHKDQLESPSATDIYSAGIILFLLKSNIHPYIEGKTLEGTDLRKLMYSNNEEFWRVHRDLANRSDSFYDEGFTQLFNGMVAENPKQRMTISQIKQSKWYNGPVYNDYQLERKMDKLINKKDKI